ncbi:na+-driven multidrug efflux pump [Stylonychia lemnae]|uniref:Na+-driven multidrug efflux pump n=1 Tax=Stylonychia lemnae TaxID=5949 RepID=A0A078A327_STYLE|nr:na+-driven multidrug efflux pump [Stylonychia lemnae]|eukprot:CDW76683.1 na+-driven multidrug efflux pump [Stylonychia lemnae]
MSQQIFIEVINLGFVGHLGSASLVAGVGLGNMYLNTTALAVLIGLNNGVATFVSQSYGQGNMRLCGLYLNRGRIVVLLAFLVMLPILLMAEGFFKLINMDAESSKYAQDYVKIMIPSLIFASQFDITKTFLNCFGRTNIQMVIQLITTPLHALWSYIFVTRYELGLQGTAIATITTTLINSVAITLYVTFFVPELKEAWFLPTRDSLRGMGQYLKMALPSMLMVCLEWWTFEIQTFFASFISVEATGSQVIILNMMYIYFCSTMGLQVAGYSLIGQSIGSQDIQLAKQYRKMIFIIGSAFSLIQCFSLYMLRFVYANLFTNILSLRDIISDTFRIIAFVQLADCTQGWLQGMIRGLGRLSEATYGQLFCLYCICLPLGWLFGIHFKMGLSGLWWGMMIGLSLLALFYIYLVTLRFNWDEVAKDAKIRSERDLQKDEDDKIHYKAENLEKFENDLKQPLIN